MKNNLTTTQTRWGLLLVLVIYLGLTIAISQVTPFNKGPDEGINLDYVTFIVEHGRLPVTYEEREQVGPKANWPALYHSLVAAAGYLAGVELASPPHIKIYWDSFRYRAIDLNTENPWFILTEDQVWPYTNRILLIHLGRWLAIIGSSLTLIFVYAAGREILPSQPWLALRATALLAFIPAYTFIGSVFNEDGLIAALAALYFWMMVRAINQPQMIWPYWVMGLALGISVTVKYTTVVLPLEVIGVISYIGWTHGWGWMWNLKRIALVGCSSMLASSWWFGWNFWFLNEVDQLGIFAGLLRPLLTGGTDVTMSRLGNIFTGGQIGLTELPQNVQVGTFNGWVRGTFSSFWGVGSGGPPPWFPYPYFVISLLLIVALVGLYRSWRTETATRLWLVLLTGHTLIFFIAPLVRFFLSRRLGQTAQGRHILIPAATAIVLLLVWGIAKAIPKRWQGITFAAIIAGFIAWTGAHVHQLATFSPPLLPMRTVAHAAESLTHPMNARFGEVVELVSYDVHVEADKASVQVELAWRALTHAKESDQLLITVIDSKGQPVSHWLGHHGHGRLPTLAWEPGDVIFDRLALPLPNLPSDDYTLHIELIGREGPLPIEHRTAPADHELTLTRFTLDQPTRINLSEQTASPALNFATWQADGPVALANQPVYRYPGTISFLTPPDTTVTLTVPDGHSWTATRVTKQLHTFVIGPRWVSGSYTIQLEAVDGTTETATWPVIIENWWPRQFEPPEIANPVEANFANQLLFLGYNLPEKQVQAGEAFPLTLYWQALPDTPPQADFIQFNNLLDATGTRRGGYDRYPLEYYNTLLWAAGEVVIDGYAVPVDATAPAGQYYLDVGYYLIVGESAVNLPLVVDGDMTEQSSVTIGPIEVVAP